MTQLPLVPRLLFRLGQSRSPASVSTHFHYQIRTTMTQTTPTPQRSSVLKKGGAEKLDVWTIFNPANMPKDSINLGQGFMNWAPPQFLKDAAVKALTEDVAAQHYSPARGRPRLRNAISSHYSPEFTNLDRPIDPETEILVTAGANEGMYATLLAFLEPGDEVICIEPFFDQYTPSIIFNGGVPVYVPLHPPKNIPAGKKAEGKDWTIDFDELRAAVTSKTKIIILNTPHNPVGKMFTREELEGFASVAIDNNILVLADEVYDCLSFDGKKHERIATLPGMWERTITVGSAGKSFAATGWRVGWLIAPPPLINAALAASTRIIFCTNSPLQEACATGLELANSKNFFESQREDYAARRQVLMDAFDKVGANYTVPDGAYFLLVDIKNFKVPEGYTFPEHVLGRGRDFQVCWFIAQELKVASIPPSEFYSKEHVSIGENFARFAFCKDVETLKTAGERLQRLKEFM